MLRRVDWPPVTVSRPPVSSIRMGQAASVPEGRQLPTNIRYVTSQKSKDLMQTAMEA